MILATLRMVDRLCAHFPGPGFGWFTTGVGGGYERPGWAYSPTDPSPRHLFFPHSLSTRPRILHRQQCIPDNELIWKDGKTGTGWATLSVIYNLVLRQARLLSPGLWTWHRECRQGWRYCLERGFLAVEMIKQLPGPSLQHLEWFVFAFCLFFRKVEQVLFFFFKLFILFLTTQYSRWDISSPTRYRTCSPCFGSPEF